MTYAENANRGRTVSDFARVCRMMGLDLDYRDRMPSLTLHRVTTHPHIDHAYRVRFQGTEVGSIGLHHLTSTNSEWRWGLDCVLPGQPFPTSGSDQDRDACMVAFRSMWDRFASDPDRLREFMEMVGR